MTPYFSDRSEAGKFLAKELAAYKNKSDTVVLALPRGGVPVGFEIAEALRLPLDLMLVRKLGVPGHEEYAMGAIAIGNIAVFNEEARRHIPVSRSALERIMAAERVELTRRNNVYRGGKPAPTIKGKTVILVDDGMATGSNMRVAVAAVHKQEPAKVVVAVPIASESAYEILSHEVDEVVCPFIPAHFYSLGSGYVDFRQMEDSEVIDLLKKAERLQTHASTKRERHEPVNS